MKFLLLIGLFRILVLGCSLVLTISVCSPLRFTRCLLCRILPTNTVTLLRLIVAVSAFNLLIMRCTAIFDPKRDVAEVQQHVAIDLADCFKNHVVPSQVNEEELQYGNIENPSQIAGRPSDIFEAMQANRSFSEALEAKKHKAD